MTDVLDKTISLVRLPRLVGLLGLALATLSPLKCAAQFADDFTADGSLNPNLWTIGSSLMSGLASEFNSTLIQPVLGFNGAGMNFSGVNGRNQLSGVQSVATFQPPFTVTTTVTSGEAHGNAYELFLESADLTQWLEVPGNLNPGNGSYFGVWVNYENSGLAFLSLGNNLYSDPSTNSEYTIQMFVENNGVAAVTLFSSKGIVLGVQSNLDVGPGPFYLILGQREGGPNVSGPNVATWENVSLISPGPAPVLAPITGANGTLTLAWSAVAGATYQAQYTTTLAPTQWNNLGPPVTANAPEVIVTDTPADAQRFYRVVMLP